VPPRTRITQLPGIGVQYDLTTADGEPLSVIAHRNGSRSLNGYLGGDLDACSFSLHFTGHDAAAAILTQE
jgi:TrkA domain protein